MRTYSMRHDEERDVWIVTVRKLGNTEPIATEEKASYAQAKRWIEKQRKRDRTTSVDVPLR